MLSTIIHIIIYLTQINKLDTSHENLFEKNLPEFENAPWKVTFSSDLLKAAMSSVPVAMRKRLIQIMLNLAHGQWPKFELKSNAVPAEYAEIIHVYRIMQYRLVWSIDVYIRTTPPPQQYLRMWSITTDAELPREIRKVLNGGIKLYSSDYRERCAKDNRPPGGSREPASFAYNDAFVWYKPFNNSGGLQSDSALGTSSSSEAQREAVQVRSTFISSSSKSSTSSLSSSSSSSLSSSSLSSLSSSSSSLSSSSLSSCYSITKNKYR